MRRGLVAAVIAAGGCAGAPSFDEARLASSAPELASCAGWFQALDREVAAAGVRDLEYASVPGFPYLRADPFLVRSRTRAAAGGAAFDAFADRLLERDLESRRNEIDNLPAAVVEKWSGMRLDESRDFALRRSVQCGRLLRQAELARPELRATLLERVVPAAHDERPACPPFAGGAGAVVRFAPPAAAVSRATVAGWLLRGELDPLGQPLLSDRQLSDMAAAYAPSLEVTVASDGDRFGALRWRRGIAEPEIDAAEPALYVGASYASYEGRGLLQLVYTVLFPGNRITWRVTLAPDGEPLVYELSGADGCRAAVLTPRARSREAGDRPAAVLPRMPEGARPLLALAPRSHEIRVLGAVRGSDSLARYTLRSYEELRSAPTLEGRNRAAAGRPAFADGDAGRRFVLDLAEPRP